MRTRTKVISGVLGGMFAVGLVVSAFEDETAADADVPSPSSSSPEPEVDWTAELERFAADNALPAADWWEHVEDVDVAGGAVTVETGLYPTELGEQVAGRICGAYSIFAFDHQDDAGVVYVRAGDGLRLAKCGPRA